MSSIIWLNETLSLSPASCTTTMCHFAYVCNRMQVLSSEGDSVCVCVCAGCLWHHLGPERI